MLPRGRAGSKKAKLLGSGTGVGGGVRLTNFNFGLTTEYRANFLDIFVGVARWLGSPD